jgi:hypothetical protein
MKTSNWKKSSGNKPAAGKPSLQDRLRLRQRIRGGRQSPLKGINPHSPVGQGRR